MNKSKLILLLVVTVAIARLLPHPYNFTPIGAFALFSGAYITDKRFILLPLAALLIGDLLTGFYSAVVMVFVYLGFAGSAAVGRLFLSRKRTPFRFVAGVLSGAIVFYLVSNIGMWWVAFPTDINGLLACWIEGLPFLTRTIAGDFFYAALIFGIVELYERQRTLGYAS
ncbi:MAG: DUF6580 family putative transport protein [Candidatus Azotimanducaceae bacterium WSBS_2022_MAG_OTU7]